MSPDSVSATRSLSVVICAYTMARVEDLHRAVRSVQHQYRPVQEVLLVIDHCPELESYAREFLTGVRVVDNTGRRGLSGARNTGLAEAGGEVVAFLDDDAAADPCWTEHLLAAYREPEVLGVGGLVRPRWDSARPPWFPPEFDWVVGCSYRGLPERSGPVRNFIGANMSFRRAEVLAAGGFRTDLGRVGTRPLGCEETELCLRLSRRRPGAELRYEPAATVSHHVPDSRATWTYFLSRCYAEGLSKAAVARLSGRGPGLASERTYLRSTIPRALVRCLRPRSPAPRRLAALGGGVLAAGLGYTAGRIRLPASAPATGGTP
ncbi:glycosyltransferase family 2 protein [Kitasatospora terrestris]|uniref:Glycosyltransferase 2-like domain-containing protein n=1 Tax=Kitasatospora terrestris TaxID=258051 RepID=A0ABP9E8Y2_9ACTN